MRLIAFIFIFSNHVDAIVKIPWLQHAKLGVAFFFIISGFLNGYLNKGVDKLTIRNIAKYTKNKMAKIYPLFLFVIIAMAPRVGLFNVKNWSSLLSFLGKLIPGVTLTSSWINSQDHYFAFFGGIWYMSTFFFLIILTPALIKIVTKIRDSNHGILKLIILASVLYSSSMIWAWAMNKNTFFTYIFPPARIFEYFIGIIFGSIMATRPASVKQSKKLKKASSEKIYYSCLELGSILGVLGVAAIARICGDQNLPVFLSRQGNIYTVPLIFMVCVFVKQKGVMSLILSNRPMVLLGRASMYLYLIHQPLIYSFRKLVPTAKGWTFSLYILIITIIISLYLYKHSKGKKNENRPSRTQ